MPGCRLSGTPAIAPPAAVGNGGCCSPGMGPSAEAGVTGMVPLYVETGVDVERRSGVSAVLAAPEVQGLFSAWDVLGEWLAWL